MFWLEKYASLKNFMDAFSLFWLLALVLSLISSLSIYEFISSKGTLFPTVAPILTLLFLVAFALYKFGGQTMDYKKFIGTVSFVQMCGFGALLATDLSIKSVGSIKGSQSQTLDLMSIIIAACFMRIVVYTHTMVEAFSQTYEKEETSKEQIVESLLWQHSNHNRYISILTNNISYMPIHSNLHFW